MKSLEESLLRKALAEGLVSMRYVKKNGDTRNAVGTRCLTLIPEEQHPKSPEERKVQPWLKDDYVRYYDFTVQDWRTLVVSEIIEWKRLNVELAMGG